MITNSDVKEYLDIDAATWDDEIDNIISRVESQIVSYLGQHIDAQTGETDLFTGNGRGVKTMVNFPITTLSSLEYRLRPTDSFTTIDSDEYTLFEMDTLYHIYYKKGFDSGYQYKATYNYGFAQAPEDVKGVAIEICADKILNSYMEIGKSRHGLKQESKGSSGTDMTTSFIIDWKHEWIMTLGKYRTVI